MATPRPRPYGCHRARLDLDQDSPRRRHAARLAPAPASQPARPGGRGRRVVAPPQLRRDGEGAGAAAGRSPHLSFVETGRSRPSREMVLHLAEHLDVPLRDRNALLLAAGFAPVYQESPLDAPELHSVRQAIEVILDNHEPCPAFVIDGA